MVWYEDILEKDLPPAPFQENFLKRVKEYYAKIHTDPHTHRERTEVRGSNTTNSKKFRVRYNANSPGIKDTESKMNKKNLMYRPGSHELNYTKSIILMFRECIDHYIISYLPTKPILDRRDSNVRYFCIARSL